MSAEETRPKDDLTAADADEASDEVTDVDAASNEVAEADEVSSEVADGGETAAAEITEEIDTLSAQLEQVQAKADEYLDSLQRERASFQNFKRRVERERDEQRQQIVGSMLLKLLPTLDDFHRAMEAVPDTERDEWFDGVALIQRKLEKFLEDEGVTEIEALGQVFDPNYHEAIGVDSESDAESGTITLVLQRGYMHGDRLLRPALVRVAE